MLPGVLSDKGEHIFVDESELTPGVSNLFQSVLADADMVDFDKLHNFYKSITHLLFKADSANIINDLVTPLI